MTRKAIWLAVPLALVAFSSCGSDKQVATTDGTIALAASPEASLRAVDLRRQFSLPASAQVRFEQSGDKVSAFVAGSERVTTPADVVLPAGAAGPTRVVDRNSKLAVSFALKGATGAPLTVGDAMAVYLGGYGAADIVHRVHAEGTEDYVSFATRPSREEIAYDVDVSQAAGLRLVEDTHTLELLDGSGAPRLRVARPYVVDARGQRHDASLTLHGCAYDVSPAPPWGRAVTPPGATHCEVRVGWSHVDYPALVDPKWVTTGSMSKSREHHTSTLLNTGLVLITGGDDTSTKWNVAELYNDSTTSFALTGTMKSPRSEHTATLLGNGTVLLVGGHDGGTSGYVPSAEIYNPSTGVFALTGSLTLGGRARHTATRLNNGNVLVAAGATGSGTDIGTAEIFNGSSFAATGSLTAREGHSATLLSNGNVLVAGGANNGTGLKTAYLFTGSSFVATGSMQNTRYSHTATLLPSGAVVIVGGEGGNQTAELYVGSSFALTGAPKEKYLRHHATLLDSGKVLVGHGFYNTSGFTELYDPATATFAYSVTSSGKDRQWPAASKLQNGNVLVTGGSAAFTGTSGERYTILQAGATGCLTNDDCRSGVCQDPGATTGVCCSSASCTGACRACTAGTGACVTVVSADDPDTCNGASTCSALGACKLKQGQTCNLGSSCASGSCSDGYCCDKACTGGCDRCDTTPGTCKIVANGTTGVNPSCGGFVCDGVNPGCPGSCTNDGDCADGQFCSSNGTCQPKKVNGSACNPAADCKDPACAECTGAACVDGVCCDTTCTGLCQACSAALKQSGADGKCGPAKEGTNPHNDVCPVDPQNTCKQDGKCSGSGGCRAFYPAGTSCGTSQCNSDTNKATGFICNGAGTCANDPVGVSCFDYICDAGTGSCPNSCLTDAQCSPTAYCNAGSCVPKATNGAACTQEKECASALCVDGFCCNATCDGQCEACDVTGAEGTCAPLTGAPHKERPKCAASDPSKPCATSTCDGDTRTSCAGFVGPEVRCGAASCANGSAVTAGNCHKGECVTSAPVGCGAYACGDNACKTTCESKDDCATGNLCDTTTKHCIAQATCDGDHTTTGANGQKQDCTPYKCQGDGTCRQTCTSIDDCVAPTACDLSGKCVLPPAADGGGDSGGCSMTSSRSPSSELGLFGLALAASAVIRRRRRRSGQCQGVSAGRVVGGAGEP